MAPVSEDAFLSEATSFLRAHAGKRDSTGIESDAGSDAMGLFDDPVAERDLLERARAWRRILFDGGFGWISGPPEYGGRGLTKRLARRFAELEEEFDAPDQMRLSIGLGIVGPTLAAYGSREAKERYLRAIYRGDIVAC